MSWSADGFYPAGSRFIFDFFWIPGLGSSQGWMFPCMGQQAPWESGGSSLCSPCCCQGRDWDARDRPHPLAAPVPQFPHWCHRDRDPPCRQPPDMGGGGFAG